MSGSEINLNVKSLSLEELKFKGCDEVLCTSQLKKTKHHTDENDHIILSSLSEVDELSHFLKKKNKKVETKKKVSTPYCFYDTFSFEGHVYEMPIRYDNFKFITWQKFCSPSCIKRCIMDTERFGNKHIILLNQMMREVYKFSFDDIKIIVPAPSRCRLEKYGGDLSIHAFRTLIELKGTDVPLFKPFIPSSIIYREHTPLNETEKQTSPQPSEVNSKSLTTNMNTLQVSAVYPEQVSRAKMYNKLDDKRFVQLQYEEALSELGPNSKFAKFCSTLPKSSLQPILVPKKSEQKVNEPTASRKRKSSSSSSVKILPVNSNQEQIQGYTRPATSLTQFIKKS